MVYGDCKGSLPLDAVRHNKCLECFAAFGNLLTCALELVFLLMFSSNIHIKHKLNVFVYMNFLATFHQQQGSVQI